MSKSALTNDFLHFLEASPSPFHAVESSRKLLIAAGYTEIKERNALNLQRSGKYFYTRNQSALVAFAVGGNYHQGNAFSIIGAHTDSPCLKVRPVSKKEKFGLLQVGVELYGGGLWHTWFDRDLSLAGRVMVKTDDNRFEHRLVRIRNSILKIPNLAIHLTSERDTFTFNKEVHLTPILGQAAEKLLNAIDGDESTDTPKQSHHSVLLNMLAKELDVKVSAIADFELCLYDTHAPCVGGAADEFIFSARLDNLGMSFCALHGLINSGNLATESTIRMVALFDNEEVGSVSSAGADGNLLLTAIKRIGEYTFDHSEAAACTEVQSDLSNDKDNWYIVSMKRKSSSHHLQSLLEEALLKSMLISADMAHGIHPNYAEKHEENHRPLLNKGVVIKQNANQRYATTSVTSVILKQVAIDRGLSLQEFVVRNDSPCGSTIGPMLSAKLGIRTIGNAQWSMHSIRETCGTHDIKSACDLFTGFFEMYARLEAMTIVD